MHANRPFLLDRPKDVETAVLRRCVSECLDAARDALETVDAMFPDRLVAFHSLWWTPYLTFTALAVVYVWEIQLKVGVGPNSASLETDEDPSLLALAERCQCHLASAITSDSASRRYSIIIEELRLEARHHLLASAAGQGVSSQVPGPQMDPNGQGHVDEGLGSLANHLESSMCDEGAFGNLNLFNPVSQWQAADWLEIDSSAFALFADLEASPTMTVIGDGFLS
jgi:hypothetical protein